MDRCDSRTRSNHLATAAPEGEGIISAFHVKCALMKVIIFSATEKSTADLQPHWPRWFLKGGKKGFALRMVLLLVASWHSSDKCLREGKWTLLVKTSRLDLLFNEKEERDPCPISASRTASKYIPYHIYKYTALNYVDWDYTEWIQMICERWNMGD